MLVKTKLCLGRCGFVDVFTADTLLATKINPQCHIQVFVPRRKNIYRDCPVQMLLISVSRFFDNDRFLVCLLVTLISLIFLERILLFSHVVRMIALTVFVFLLLCFPPCFFYTIALIAFRQQVLQRP